MAPKPKIKKINSPAPAKGSTTQLLRIPSVDEVNEPPTEFTEYMTLLYGGKGMGKTSGSSSFPDYLNCSFEPRRRNIRIRQTFFEVKKSQDLMDYRDEHPDEDPLNYDAWRQFVEIGRQAVEDPTVSGIAVDTVDLAYSACQESICFDRGNPNLSAKCDGINGWDDLRMTFTGFFTYLASHGLGILFISHAKEREQEFMDGAEGITLVGPSCTPACEKIMKQLCDFWFYYTYHESRRCLIIRDPEMNINVACGNGFMDANGEPLRRIYVPEARPEEFYSTISSYYKGEATKKQPVKKKAIRKK